eukprot:1477660-Rhodomonas_salina.1
MPGTDVGSFHAVAMPHQVLILYLDESLVRFASTDLVPFCTVKRAWKRACVVLLHEDYPLELPVFGPRGGGGEGGEGEGGGERGGGEGEREGEGEVWHAVFVLGTVRDMTGIDPRP